METWKGRTRDVSSRDWCLLVANHWRPDFWMSAWTNKCCCSYWKNHSFQYQLTANTSSFQLSIGTTMASDNLLQASWWTKGFNYLPDCSTPGARRTPSRKQLNHGYNYVPDCPMPGTRRPTSSKQLNHGYNYIPDYPTPGTRQPPSTTVLTVTYIRWK